MRIAAAFLVFIGLSLIGILSGYSLLIALGVVAGLLTAVCWPWIVRKRR